MMVVKILGTGCAKCKALEEKVQNIARRYNLDVSIEKVTDLDRIMEYGIMMTPGLVVDEEVKSFGHIPKEEQLRQWLHAG